MHTEAVYIVRFKEPPLENDDRTDFIFSSLSAIYETFTREQIGCAVERLWTLKVSDGIPYIGKRCKIRREEVKRKAQKRPYKSVSKNE